MWVWPEHQHRTAVDGPWVRPPTKDKNWLTIYVKNRVRPGVNELQLFLESIERTRRLQRPCFHVPPCFTQVQLASMGSLTHSLAGWKWSSLFMINVSAEPFKVAILRRKSAEVSGGSIVNKLASRTFTIYALACRIDE